jgi:hypothetical protein
VPDYFTTLHGVMKFEKEPSARKVPSENSKKNRRPPVKKNRRPPVKKNRRATRKNRHQKL